MKYELTKDQIEEIVCCIVDCGLNRDEACEYALNVASDCIEAEEWPSEDRIDAIGKNGGDGAHYALVATGVYDA